MWAFMLILMLVSAVEQRKSLNAPRKITAKALSPHSVEVNWRDPDFNNKGGAKLTRLYIVRYRDESQAINGSDSFGTVRARHRRVKLYRLEPNSTYEIWVKAVKNKRSSAWSKAITVTTHGLEDKIYMVRNLTAIPVASDAILLSWLPPEQANRVVAYTILTQLANGIGRLRRDVANNEMLEYKIGNLRPHLLYSFRVQTMQKLSPHPISPAVHAQPFSDVPSGPPRDVTLRAVNSSSIIVTWQPPSPHQRNGQLLGYTIQYKHARYRHDETTTVTTDRDVREFSLRGLTVNETYQVQVAANTVNGTGPFTKWEAIFVAQSTETETSGTREYKKEGTIITPGTGLTTSSRSRHGISPLPPSEVKVENKTGSSVNLVWTAPLPVECCPVVAYKILINNYNDSSEYEIVRGSTHVQLTGLAINTVYGVRVSTLSLMSESRPSKVFIFTTDEAAPPKILSHQTMTAFLGGQANLTCTARGFEIPKIDWLVSSHVGGEGNEDHLVQILNSYSGIAGNVRIIPSMETHDSVTSSLLLYNITQAAEREFVCMATNSLGSEKLRLYLSVNEPPRIVTSNGSSVRVSATARLVCEVYGKPVPEIVWVHYASGTVYNETKETNSDLRYSANSNTKAFSRQSNLVIKNSSLQDEGVYTCIAQSRAGRAQAQVVLYVKVHPPGPVHKIQTIPLSPTRVSVSWLPPLNYGYNIAYYQVSYRKKRGGQPLVFNTTRVGTELYDLDHSMEYLVGVIAGTDDSLGESGPEVEVMTLTNDGLQPANVSVKSLNTSIIQLDWEPPASVSPMYIRGYNVYSRREGEDRTEKLFVRGSSSKQFLIGLGRDDTYYLKISTLMTWGYEAHSPWIPIQKRTEAFLPPGKPLIVTAIARLSEITLTWEPPTVSHTGLQPMHAQLKGYKIVYGPLNDPLNVSRVTLEADKRMYVLTRLDPGTKYIISIRAFNDIGDGEPVYTRTITQALPPSMVQNASAQPVSSTEIHVHWDPPIRGQVTRYHIRYWRPGRKDKQSAWLNGNFQNYVAGSLRKNSSYRFEIIPYNEDLLGDGIVIFSYTYGDKPDGPPTDVSIRPLNATTLIAKWKQPDPEKANGHIIAYKLVLRSKGGSRMASFTVHGSADTYTFYNTPVSMMYKLRMAAITANGTGVYSTWVECPFSASPEKPGSPQNLSVSEMETSLTLSWRPPTFTGAPVHGYIVGYGQFIPEVYRQIVNASQMTVIIKSLKPDSEYITSVRAFNHIGESSPAFNIVRTKSVAPLVTALLAPVKLLVIPKSPTSLILSWVDPVLVDNQKVSDGRAYLIRFSPLSGETYSYINTSHLHHVLSDLETATKYEVSVKVVRGTNSSTWSLPVVNSTQQIAPNVAPRNIVASPLLQSPSLISLKWSEPETSNGKIEEYIIYLTSDPSLDTKLWVVMRTDRQEVKIKDILAHTTYYFKLQARNKAGYGPLSDTVVYSPPTDMRTVPTNLTVTGLHNNMSTTVKVAWSLPEVGQTTGYMVYYTDNKEHADWLVHTERGLDTIVADLEYNMTYFFKVQARYSAVYGPFSKTVSYTTAAKGLEPSPSVNIQNESKLNEIDRYGNKNNGDDDNSVADNNTSNHVIISANHSFDNNSSRNVYDVITDIDVNVNANTFGNGLFYDVGGNNETNNTKITVEYDNYDNANLNTGNSVDTIAKDNDFVTEDDKDVASYDTVANINNDNNVDDVSKDNNNDDQEKDKDASVFNVDSNFHNGNDVHNVGIMDNTDKENDIEATVYDVHSNFSSGNDEETSSKDNNDAEVTENERNVNAKEDVDNANFNNGEVVNKENKDDGLEDKEVKVTIKYNTDHNFNNGDIKVDVSKSNGEDSVTNEEDKDANEYDDVVDYSDSSHENGQHIFPEQETESDFNSTLERSIKYEDNFDTYDGEGEEDSIYD